MITFSHATVGTQWIVFIAFCGFLYGGIAADLVLRRRQFVEKSAPARIEMDSSKLFRKAIFRGVGQD